MLRRAGDLSVPGRDLGTARFETFLRRLFSVKGVVAPGIEPKISAGVELLTPPYELGESALLAGWRGYEAFAGVGAVAGQYGMIELRPTAGMVAVVEHFVVPAQAGSFSFTIGIRDARPAGSAAITFVNCMDSRYGSISSVPPAPAHVAYSGANVTAPGNYGAVYTALTTDQQLIRGPWVLTAANMSATVQCLALAANTTISATVRWWERALEPSEAAAR